jgi:type I protein arginine methyltransferase
MYSLFGYGEMIADKIRMDAYIRAVKQIVKPGSTVVEIGTGPGIFAILACQQGARRVYAIESDEVIQIARENAAANQCADRIEFVEALSTKVNLQERADAVFSDLRGVLPIYDRHIPSIVDARTRFLKPGGAFCPRRDTMCAAVASMPKLYSELVSPWESSGLEQDLTPARRRIVLTYLKSHATREHVLTEPKQWATLDYLTIASPDFEGEMSWRVERAETAHGILVWFDADLADGVSFSNSPLGPETIYSSMLFPWEYPVPLGRGDTVSVKLEAKLADKDYVWRWVTEIRSADSKATVREKFDQSSLAATIASPNVARKTASDFVLKLSDDGVIARHVLALADGRATLEEIARALAREYPDRFPNWHAALRSAGEISQKYSA